MKAYIGKIWLYYFKTRTIFRITKKTFVKKCFTGYSLSGSNVDEATIHGFNMMVGHDKLTA